MISTKNMYTVAVTLALSFFSLHAKNEKTINAITDNPDIECTLEPLTKIEAKRLFGSTGAMHSKPDDEFQTYDSVSSKKQGTTILGINLENTNGTVTHHKRLINGFSNLHCRYQVLNVTIKNNSTTAIRITKPLQTGENYLKSTNFTFELPSEIIERYETAGKLKRYFSNGVTSLSLLATIALFMNAMDRDTATQDRTGFTFCGITLGLITSALAYDTYNRYNRLKAKENLESHLSLIDNEEVDEDGEDYLTIPVGATFTDVVFINKATYRDIENMLSSTEEKPKLTYKI